MNLYRRRDEVRDHIDHLQQTANKHLKNNNKRQYNIVCEIIKDNKEHLSRLDADLKCKDRIILYHLCNEQHNSQ